jgi:hypothetical protein
MTIAVLLLLSLAQDTPEATFQKIEAELEKAVTIKITSKTAAVMALGGKEMRAEIEGTLLMKGTDRLKVRMKVKPEEEPAEEITFVASGLKTRGPGEKAGDAPKDLRQTILTLIPRLGAAVAMQAAVNIGAGRAQEKKPVASKFSKTGAGSLSFEVDYDGVTWKTTQVFDEKTHKLLRIEAKVTPTDPKSDGMAGTSRTLTETLTVEIGGDIPDKEFELPKKD